MDSGNSDSSSCGEDQEYDSRAAAAAAAYTFSSFVNHPVPPPPPPFDPFSNFLQLQNSSQLNPNVFWPRNIDLSSENPCPDNSIINFPFTAPPQPTTEVASGGNNLTDTPPAISAENGTQNRNPAARNTKKRSRASRRAPTTVLTTDTSNFRAMVQEFTGIPAPPFTSSSPFQRSRLDLYGASSIMRLKPPHDAAQPPYLHRPFAQEVHRPPPPQPFLTSTTASISSSSTTTNSAASTSTPPPMNYQSLSTQNSNLFNLISNPNLTSFLPTDQKFPFSSSVNLPSTKVQGSFEIPTNHDGLHSNVKTTVGFDEFPFRRGNVSATIGNLPNLVSSDQIQPRNDHNNDADETRTLNGIYNFSRNSTRNEKMNYLQNSSMDFHGEKGQENIGTRSSEGMMESWICSSELK